MGEVVIDLMDYQNIVKELIIEKIHSILVEIMFVIKEITTFNLISIQLEATITSPLDSIKTEINF